MTDTLKKIPRDKAFYIVGFSDGEGSFNTSFRMRDDYLLGWKITPVFTISQKQRDILALIKRYLNCGTIRYRNDGVWVYEVENRIALYTTIIPFFNTYRFLSEKKKADFTRFKQILDILESHTSTTLDDFTLILKLLNENEWKSNRKFSDQEIFERASLFWEQNQEKILKLNTKTKNPQRLHAKQLSNHES